MSRKDKEAKTVKVFLSESRDEKRIFEVIRMSLGLTLRGVRVHLFVSPDTLRATEKMEEKMKKEIDEFFEAIRYMGGDVIITSDFSRFFTDDADFYVVAV